MPFVQADLDALDRAIASGQRSYTVQYADRSESKTYHTLEEMLSLRTTMAGEIAATPVAGAVGPSRQHYVYSTKGF
jgi:hypothetical protein